MIDMEQNTEELEQDNGKYKEDNKQKVRYR